LAHELNQINFIFLGSFDATEGIGSRDVRHQRVGLQGPAPDDRSPARHERGGPAGRVQIYFRPRRIT